MILLAGFAPWLQPSDPSSRPSFLGSSTRIYLIFAWHLDTETTPYSGNMDKLDFDKIDFNDPSQFVKLLGGNMPVPPSKSPKDVRTEAKERSAKIHEKYRLLQDIVTRHEPTIQKRWPKKSKQQKLKIL